MDTQYVKAYRNNTNYYCLALVRNITIWCNEQTDIIEYIEIQGRHFDTLISNDGTHVDILSMKCSSYEEFLIALDTFNLKFGTDCSSIEEKELLALKAENDKLKAELEKISKLTTSN